MAGIVCGAIIGVTKKQGPKPRAAPQWCDQIPTPLENQLYPYSEHSCAPSHSHHFGKLSCDRALNHRLRSGREHHPLGSSKKERTAVGRSIWAADKTGCTSRQAKPAHRRIRQRQKKSRPDRSRKLETAVGGVVAGLKAPGQQKPAPGAQGGLEVCRLGARRRCGQRRILLSSILGFQQAYAIASSDATLVAAGSLPLRSAPALHCDAFAVISSAPVMSAASTLAATAPPDVLSAS